MFKDNDAIAKAERTLRLAAEHALKDTDPIAAPMAAVFEEWALVAQFSDAINRRGGPETVRLARVYLQRVWGVDLDEIKK